MICANYGEVCEIVSVDEDGIWVDPLDADAIAEAISRFGTDANLRARMSQHSRFDADRFSIERVNAQEADLYLSTISTAH